MANRAFMDGDTLVMPAATCAMPDCRELRPADPEAAGWSDAEIAEAPEEDRAHMQSRRICPKHRN